MRVAAITLSLCLGLAGTAAADDGPKGKNENADGAAKSRMAEVRSIVRDLERSTSTLTVLLKDVRGHLEERPPKAQQQQLERWEGAFDQLLRSLQKAHAAVVETTKRLNEGATAQLPTSLAKEVANARNEAEPMRAAAEQVLKQHKPKPQKTSKRATKAPEAAQPDDLRLDDVDL